MPPQQRKSPEIKWEDNQLSVTLPPDDARTVNATWKPAITYVVRIWEVGVTEFRLRDTDQQLHLRRSQARHRIRAAGPHEQRVRRGRACVVQHPHQPRGTWRQRRALPQALTARPPDPRIPESHMKPIAAEDLGEAIFIHDEAVRVLPWPFPRGLSTS